MNSKLSHFLVFIFLLSISSFAADSGSIKGIITDADTNEPLVGANIIIEGTLRGAATDMEGKYRITNVPAGDHILVVTYIGYQSKRQSVIVIPNMTTELNLSLKFEALEGKEIVITGQLEGQSQAINRQITANTIVNVVSSDKIQELPDQNAAESVGRLPGISIQRDAGEGQKVVVRGLSPRFNSITINGVSIPSTDPEDRSVDLSMISPDVLAGIEVYKSLTPDRDGDAIGGEVNFITQKAQEGLKEDARIETGYDGLDKKYGQYRGSLKLSNRFFDNNLGIILTGGLQSADRSSYSLNADYGVQSEKQGVAVIILNQLNLDDQIETRKRYNAGLSLDYKLSNGELFFNGLWGKTDRDILIRGREYSTEQNNQYRTMTSSKINIQLWSASISGKHFLLPGILNIDANWLVAYTRTDQETPFSHYVLFREVSALANNVVLTGGPSNIPSYAYNRLDQTFFKTSNLNQESVYDDDKIAKLDLKIPFDLSDDFLGYVKFGGKYRDKSRGRDLYSLKSNSFGIEQDLAKKYPDRWDLTGLGQIKFSNFEDPNFVVNDFLNGQYDFGPGLDPGKLNNFLEQYREENVGTEAHPNHIYQPDPTALIKSYTASEKVAAGYIMTEFHMGPSWMFLAGARYEKTINDFKTTLGEAVLSSDEQQIIFTGRVDTTGTSFYEEWLPMAHLRFKPTSWFDVRLAVTRSLSRPNYFNLVPKHYLSDLGGTLNLGNPDLKPITSWNYDVFFSFYGQPGLFTIGLYKKEVHDVDYVRTRRAVPSDGFGKVILVVQPVNITSISPVYGCEIELQTNLHFLPSPFDGIVLYANYSYIHSKTYYPFLSVTTGGPPFFKPSFKDTVREAPMIGQAKQIANFAVGFEKWGFSGRLSMSYQGAMLQHVDLREELDQYTAPYLRWDLAVQQQVYDGLSLFLNVNNISNRPDNTYLWKEVYATDEAFYGWSGDLGIRYKF